MGAPVEFGLATSNSFPSGTGSYSYDGSFQVVVQNLAYEKQVSIWAQVGTVWQDIFAVYTQSLPGDLELWKALANNSEGEFVTKYTVNGVTHWDNNGWKNYRFPQVFDDFAVIAGRNYKVVLGTASLAAGAIHVSIGVQNLAYEKVVGIVYTTDNWATVQIVYAHYSFTMKSGLEVWQLTAPVGAATDVELALFYRVLGAEYWDNNFWRNYRVTPENAQQWGSAS